MKKHLIAAAVAAAVAAPVMAQNVSISGYAEAGFESTKTAGGTATTSKLITSNILGTSNLKFSASEDLGGGMKASLRLESSLGVINGGLGASTLGGQASSQQIFDRGAEVGLSGAFGSVRVGKLDHPGIEGNEVQYIGNIGLNNSIVEGETSASDTNSTLIYSTPKFNGMAVTVGYTGKDDGAAASSFAYHAGIRSYQLAGTFAGLDFKLGGGEIKDRGAAGAGKTSFVGGGIGKDLGFAKVAVHMNSANKPEANSEKDATQTTVSALIPLGNGFDARVAFQNIDVKTTSTGDKDITTLALVKALSKRTNVIAMYRDIDNTGSNNTQEMGIYVGHSF
jgi:predicted porin